MRILFGSFLIMTAGVLLSQSSPDLRSRYGEPELERFIARPGIGLTVQYGSDHLACQVLIESPQPLIYAKEDVPFMSSEAVTDILEEIVPAHSRGREIGRAITASGCNEFQLVEYENVTIMRSTHNCLPLKPDREIQATVALKRDICPKPKTPFTFSRP